MHSSIVIKGGDFVATYESTEVLSLANRSTLSMVCKCDSEVKYSLVRTRRPIVFGVENKYNTMQ